MLGIYEEIQEKAREEVMRILPDNNSIDNENISQLKIVERIVKETLRLFPIAPIMARTSIGEIKLGKKKERKKGKKNFFNREKNLNKKEYF